MRVTFIKRSPCPCRALPALLLFILIITLHVEAALMDDNRDSASERQSQTPNQSLSIRLKPPFFPLGSITSPPTPETTSLLCVLSSRNTSNQQDGSNQPHDRVCGAMEGKPTRSTWKIEESNRLGCEMLPQLGPCFSMG